MSAQDRTLDRYHELMQINAAAHLLRTAREVGLLDVLGEGQKTLEQIAERLELKREATRLLLDCLVAMQVVEQYEEDYALAQVTRLLSQYDRDLGDNLWAGLADSLRGESEADVGRFFDAAAATQWIHTPAAMQAAEMLDIGGQRAGLHLLDLGCGSAVWSCAMAYRDPQSRLTVVDVPARLRAAEATAQSIELGERFETIAGEIDQVELPSERFDLVILAGQLHPQQGTPRAAALLERAQRALREGGEVVVIDLFRGPARPGMSEAVAALRMEVATPGGEMLPPEQTQGQLEAAGFGNLQFSFLPASPLNWGVIVARKPESGLRCPPR